MSFHVGQKVVCVDDRPGGYKTLDSRTGPAVIKGEIYVISGLLPGRIDHTLGLENQTLVAIDPFGNWFGYGQWRFKPLEEKSDPISLLRAITPDTPIIEQGDKWDKRVPAKVKS